MIEKLFAILGLLVCAALLLRMALGPARRRAWDRFWQEQWQRLRVGGWWLQRQWQLLRSSRGARRAAQDAIDRAARASKHAVDRDGNVIRPRSFRKDDSKKPPLH